MSLDKCSMMVRWDGLTESLILEEVAFHGMMTSGIMYTT
jgi:hypothetical protein